MSTAKERRKMSVIDEEIKIILIHIDWYENKFPDLILRRNLINEDRINVLAWLGAARMALKKKKIKLALTSVLGAHDIYYAYLPELKEKPWNDEFDALLVKYNLNRD